MQLEGETEEGLWLLEVLNELESAQEHDAKAFAGIGKNRRGTHEEETHFSSLIYQEFVATTAVSRRI